MSTRRIRLPLAVAALSLLAGLGGIGVATGVATGVAQASSSPVISVQDQGGHDGAGVDTDGTQGDFRAAVSGRMTGPLMDAVPQFKAG